jgi:hypothetical protein
MFSAPFLTARFSLILRNFAINDEVLSPLVIRFAFSLAPIVSSNNVIVALAESGGIPSKSSGR